MVQSAYGLVKDALFLQGVYRNRDSTRVYQFQEIDRDSRVVFEERDTSGRRRTIGLSLRGLTRLIPIRSRADLNLLERCGLKDRDIPDGCGID
jgi:hypothetical protein